MCCHASTLHREGLRPACPVGFDESETRPPCLSECVRVDNVVGWIASIYQESLKTNKRVDSKDTVPIIAASLKGVSYMTGSEAMQASDYPPAENRRSPARNQSGDSDAVTVCTG